MRTPAHALLQGLFKLIDKVYRDAKAVPDAKEYIKRVVDSSTDRVPPNRLVIKQVSWAGAL